MKAQAIPVPISLVNRWHQRRRWRSARHQGGTAAVEFALLLPVLLGLLLGTVDVGWMLYDKAVITNASREGARAGIVLRNPKLSNTEIANIVQQYTQANLISMRSGNAPQVRVFQSNPATYPNTLEVSVSYTFRGLLLGNLMPSLGSPWVIHARTVMVNE